MIPRRAGGFTLIEVLLVILLIGLLAATVVYSFSGESRQQRLEKETEKLQARVQLAAELAMLKNVELGLYIDDKGYRFMLFEQDKWRSIREPKALAPYEFKPGFSAKIELEGLEWAEQNLLSRAEFEPEDDGLSEANSFDELAVEKQLEEEQKQQAEADKERADGKVKKPVKRQTGILTTPPQKKDPRYPTVFILSSGEISPFLLELKEDSERPVLTQSLKAVFSIPLERGQLEQAR
ncbi:type II secretion system minor pseudopilin GspH [Rheinheimera texasensis]|uniref:type II secretion system minor pseudopilin GspH n=1 Tax=Rheinheimera texasensis TaxID=306205 RepID=UPI0004E1FF44|nr:type II secretion system minor pseudopilin GspH [Rheinheimera texasensis]